MTQCPSCGSPVDEGESFCSSCGATIPQSPQAPIEPTVFCQWCGEKMAPSEEFCPSCGKKVAEEGPAPPGPGSESKPAAPSVPPAPMPEAAMSPPLQPVPLPKGSPFDPSRDMAAGERLESDLTIHPLSVFKSYVVGAMLVVAAYLLYAQQPYLLMVDLAAAYFIHAASLRVRSVIWSLVKLYVIFIIFSFASSLVFFAGLVNGGLGGPAAQVQLTALYSTGGLVAFEGGIISMGFQQFPVYVEGLVALIALGGVWAAYSAYRRSRGERVFFTNRRLIILKKFGGTSMFQTTMDAVSAMSSTRGLGGRAFGYGAINVTTEPEAGLAMAMGKKAKGGIRLTVNGIRDPEQAVNAFTKLRMSYMDASRAKGPQPGQEGR